MSAHIWLPGAGTVDLSVKRVDTAVREYDERLRFGRNDKTGDYCIFIKMPPNYVGGIPSSEGTLYPVIGFGNQIPDAGEAIHRLRKADALKNGDAILREMNRENDSLTQHIDDNAHDASGIVAEAAEWFGREQGNLRYSKIYRPRTNRVGGWS